MQLLGVGTTLGIIAQTVALIPALRRVGFPLAAHGIDFRRGEVAEIGRMAGWMFGYIAATQVAFLVTTKVAGDASVAGVTEYNYAWLLFQLPYAVVGISVITALLPRMSAHAAERRYGLVRQDFSAGDPAGGGHRGAVLAGAGRARAGAGRGLPGARRACTRRRRATSASSSPCSAWACCRT